MPDLDSLASPGLEWRIGGRATRDSPMFDEQLPLAKLPSEYWDGNCFVGASFLARYEALRYDEPGMQNVLWGSDYPHTEGTWPVTEYVLAPHLLGHPRADCPAHPGRAGPLRPETSTPNRCAISPNVSGRHRTRSTAP